MALSGSQTQDDTLDGTSSSTNGSFLDYVKSAGSISASVLAAVNSGNNAAANQQAALFNATAAQKAASTSAAQTQGYLKLALMAGAALIALILVVTLLKKK